MQGTHGVNGAEVEVFAVDKGARHAGRHRRFAGRIRFIHHPRLDPGIALPFAPLCDEIVFQHVAGADQRARVTVRAEAHVDAKYLPVSGQVIQAGDEAFTQAREKIVVVDLAAAIGSTLCFPLFGVHENVIDV